jgi:CRP/FNR family transcriptional regulator
MNASDVLEGLPLLRHLGETQRDEVIAAGRERRLERGEILFHEGESAEALFALISGRLKLVRYAPQGRELLLHLVQPGQSFAEAALFADGTYPATAEAMAKSVVWCLPASSLRQLLAASPELGLAMLGSVSMWTRKLAAKLELLTQRRVEERLALYLLGRIGERELETGGVITLTEPRNLIAAQCGTVPEVLSRTFRRFEEQGLLTAKAKRVVVHRPGALRELAERIDE